MRALFLEVLALLKELVQRQRRMETRLVRLMNHMGINESGDRNE